jgi:hypothetical protein
MTDDPDKYDKKFDPRVPHPGDKELAALIRRAVEDDTNKMFDKAFRDFHKSKKGKKP